VHGRSGVTDVALSAIPDELLERRGWTSEAIERLGLGFDGDRVVFPVRGAAGEHIGFTRYLPGASDGVPKMLADAGTSRELFPPPEMIGEDEGGGGCLWIVEGEPDCVRAWSLGLAAVAVPGAQNWKAEWAPRFSGRRVVVCFDADEAGRTGAARAEGDLAAAGIAAHVLDLDSKRDDGFDLSDFTEGAHRASERAQARQLLERCAEVAPSGSNGSGLVPEARGEARNGHGNGQVVPDPVPQLQTPEAFRLDVMTTRELCALPDPSDSDQLLGPLVVRGQRLVLGGHTGEGKTTMTLAIVHAIVSGEEFLNWHGAGGCRALVIDAEQGTKTIKRRVREAGLADSDAVDYVRVPDGLSLDSDAQHVSEVERVLERGYGIVVADPLYKLHAGDSNAEREAVDLMRRFDAWRERYRFALLLPVHLRKPVPGTGKFTIHDIFGSSAYVRGAELVLGVQRVSNGFSRLHFLKDRDGDLPIGEKWDLLFDQDEGYKLKAAEPDRDVEAEIMELLADVACLPVGKIKGAIKAKAESVGDALKTGESFEQVACRSTPAHPSNSKCWALSEGSFPDSGTGRERTVSQGVAESSQPLLFPEGEEEVDGTGHQSFPEGATEAA
jgi:hypothetical protein